MKRVFWAIVALAILAPALFVPQAAAAAENLSLEMEAEIAVYSSSGETYIRSCGKSAALSELSGDEYYSYLIKFRHTGSQSVQVNEMTVSVDGGERWAWAAFTMEPNTQYWFHVYYSNMKTRMTAGEHTVTWYIGNQAVWTETFLLTEEMNYDGVFSMPSDSDIAAHNQSATAYAPYVYGVLEVEDSYRFTEYSIDFRADTLPKTTYLSLAAMRMDFTELKRRYANVHTEYEGTTMYAGFQRRYEDKIAILSFWDIYYTDASGKQQVIRAKRLYPEVSDGNDSFGGEGEGAHTLVPYEWEEDHWYRMLLQCRQSQETGTTQVEQWVCDLENGAWTLLCRYDTGIPDSCFVGPAYFFLENYDNAFAGEVRTMEVANIRTLDAGTGQWRAHFSVSMASNGGLPKYEGSYSYGANDGSFWMITSGVGGDWYGQQRVQQYRKFSVSSAAEGSPY